jgi:hypothetical protein
VASGMPGPPGAELPCPDLPFADIARRDMRRRS